MYCPSCGSKLPGSDSFCFKCGVDLNAPRVVEEHATEPNSSSETRVAVKDRNGRTVWLPASEVDAFRKGQEAIQRGERPPDFEQKKAAIMARLLGQDEDSEKPVSAAISQAQSFADRYQYRCPNCNVPRYSKEGTCNACGLTYTQAETLVRLKKENEALQAKQQETKMSEKKKNGAKSLMGIFVSLLRNIAGLIVAFAVFFAVYLVIYWLVTLIARIPILGSIIYWPSDAAFFRTFTTRISSVIAASWVSLKIAKTTKPFCTILILLNVWAIISSLIHKNFSFSVLEDCGIFIVAAAFFFKAKPDDF